MRITANIIRDVVKGEDAKMCVAIADSLRGEGWTYNRIFRMVSNVTGIDVAKWDELLQEGSR